MALRVTAQYIDVAAAGQAAKGVNVEAQHVEVAGTRTYKEINVEAQHVEVAGVVPDYNGVARMTSYSIEIVRANDHRGLTSVLGTVGSGLATETLQLGAGSQGPSFVEPENTGQVGTRSSLAGAHLVPGRPVSVAGFQDTGELGTPNSILNQNHILAFDANTLAPGEKIGDATSALVITQQAEIAGQTLSAEATSDLDITNSWGSVAESSIKNAYAVSTLVMGTTCDHNFRIGVAESTIPLTQEARSNIIQRAAISTLTLTQDVLSGIEAGDASSPLTLSQSADVLTPVISIFAETDIDISGTWTQSADNNILALSAESTIVLTQDETVNGPVNTIASSVINLVDEAIGEFGAYGRFAFNILDISLSNPEGGVAETNIRDLHAITPEQPEGTLFTVGFMDTWSVDTRLVDTYELTASNRLYLSQDLPQPSGKRSVHAVNTLDLLQFGDNNFKTRALSNTIVVTQSTDYEKIITAVSTLTMTVTAGEGFIPLSASNTIVLTQFGRSNPLEHFADSTIVMSDLAKANIKNLFADSTITLSQDNTVQRPYRLDALSEIIGEIGGEFIPPNGPILPSIPFGMTQEAVVVNANTVRHLSSVIQVGQQASVLLVSVNGIDLVAETTLGLTQLANLSTTGFASTVIDSLTQEAVVNKNTNDLLSSISVFDEALVNKSRQDLVESLIELKQSVAFAIIRDTTECDYTPFVGGSDADTIPPRPLLPEPKVPALDPGVRFRLVYPPFDTGATVDSLDLRAPDFGNRERLQATRIQRESIGGTLNIYADPIWPNVHSLQMTFSALKQTQARGLMTFMERWIGQEIGVYDYEGRIWKGVITNPDEAVTHDGRQSFSVSLEMEAERVYQLNRTALSNLGVSTTAGQDEALALSTITISDEADYDFTPVAAAISSLDINDFSDYNRVPVGPGNTNISLNAFATRNSFFYESANSNINLGQVGASIDFGDFGNLIHNWDARTITETSGSAVSTWFDSAGTINLSNIGTARPTVQDNVLSGEKVLQFRHSVATQRLLSSDLEETFHPTNKTGTIFIVMVVREVMTNNDNLLFGTNPGSPDSTVLYLNGVGSATRPVTYKSPEGVAALETPQSVLGNDTTQLIVWQRNNNNILFRRNRVTQVGHTLATNPTPLSANLYVGGLGGGNSADMDIAQILMYDDILDLTDIEAIEGIIQAIWGV